ncbi:MAG: T9SS type A sorting domain-containing protein [Flavobacteriales bacterium]|nr:T9SS type A sorting domain-containing protein [Flavobacteriales bacterium]
MTKQLPGGFYLIFIALNIFCNKVAAQPGTIDYSFITEFDFFNGNYISSAIVNEDGSMIIGGSFITPNQTGRQISGIGKFHKDGTFDYNWPAGDVLGGSVSQLIKLDGGKILVAGVLSYYNRKACGNLIKIDKNGLEDSHFQLSDEVRTIYAITVQKDHKILVATQFGNNRFQVLRLNENGKKDETFQAQVFDQNVYALAVDELNRIYVGGWLNADSRPVIRLLENGRVDHDFNYKSSGNEIVLGIRCLKDGGLLINGNFNGLYVFLYKLLSNGQFDPLFNKHSSVIPNESINTIHVLSDQRIILGGEFLTYKNVNSKNIVGLDAFGSVDSGFYVGQGFNERVFKIVPYQNEGILVTGTFTGYDGFLSSKIIRLNLKEDLKSNFELFPNPSDGSINLEAKVDIREVQIISLNGKILYRFYPDNLKTYIQLPDVLNGLFLVKVVLGDQVSYKRLCILNR